MYLHPPTRTLQGIRQYAEKDYYWGLLDRIQMQKFLELARSVGYIEARKQFGFQVEKIEKLHHYIDNTNRADFHFLLPIGSDAQVLDLGSGYGNITIPLARHYRKVVAVDTSLELLEFVRLRAESEGLTNIDFVHVDPFEYCNLPFRTNSFDAVVVSGVLEWVGAAKLDDTPARLQKKFLAHIVQFITDAGVLYVAIENRLFPGYFFRDPHSKLPFTTHMPRFLANWYARRAGHRDGYRTYIHSRFGYIRLLKAVGLLRQSFLLPFPSYKSLAVILPERVAAIRFFLSSRQGKKTYSWKWRTLISACALWRVPGLFLSSFMIIASRKEPTCLPFVLERAAQMSSLVRPGDYLLKTYDTPTLSECARFWVFHANGRAPYAVLDTPRNPSSEGRDIRFTVLNNTHELD